MTGAAVSAVPDPLPYDPTAPLQASGNLRLRGTVSRLIALIATGSAVLAVLTLGVVVFDVATRGAKALSLHFLFTNIGGGGMANALVGSAVIVAVAAMIAVPVGILCGLYLTEFVDPTSRAGRGLKLVLDLLQGLPTIIAGVVVFGLLVATTHVESGFAGSVALAIVMLPLIARSSQEVLLLVPSPMREAADALGVERWRSVLGVILPAAMGGIATGAILSVARAAGETAPLLFLDSLYNPNSVQLNPFGHTVASVPMYMWTHYDLASQQAVDTVWSAALVLLAGILLANVAARLLLARSRSRMGL
jgi:phosphate transport system permease protein